MLVICPDKSECGVGCHHATPHEENETYNCNRNSHSGCPTCVPVNTWPSEKFRKEFLGNEDFITEEEFQL